MPLEEFFIANTNVNHNIEGQSTSQSDQPSIAADS